MAIWFETSVRYDKMSENGRVKKVTEKYLFDALSFTEAESRTIESLKPFISGDFTVSAAKKTKIAGILFKEGGDRWYLAVVNFINLDEKTGCDKKTASQILVQANNFEEALKSLNEGMHGTLSDWEIVSLSETTYMDVYPVSLMQS